MKTMDIKAELKDLIDQETNPDLLETIKSLFEEQGYKPSIEKEMVAQALKSENDIKEGKVYVVDKAESELNRRLNL